MQQEEYESCWHEIDGAAVTKTELKHSIYMHKAYKNFMLILDTVELVYAAVALPSTE